MSLDNDFVRAQFPAFRASSLDGQAFFENAGGSYMCQQVITRLERYVTERKVQPYYPFAASKKAGEEMDEARQRIAACLGIETGELSFGPSTTQNTYVLAQAFRQMLNKGDAIIVTNQDHEANTGPWRRLADEGIEVREWKVDPQSGSLALEDLHALLDEKVKLVCFPHCSNVVAEINPVAEIVKTAHAVGAVTCVDGVSFAPHGWPNVSKLGADIYLFSSYKTWGPHQGIMVVRKELAFKLPNQAHFFNGEVAYKRLTPAGPDHASVAVSAGMVDYFEALHGHHFKNSTTPAQMCEDLHGLFAQYEADLLQPFLDYIRGKNGLRLIGPDQASKRAATVSILCQEPSLNISTKLAERGIMAGHGHYYGMRVLEAMGLDPTHGVLRISMSHYTSKAEVNQAIEALDQVL
ncbi:aminotransferase class V-fold PLP-dependent enzyme [Cohaesibacter gelatinilyticus]|uniref:Selenocysteine lyase/Cysteine desulfurase n=1 Tax=Cohaesibacter gelatinilyticus TaxID=372072 RepID=A0A285PD00_9HYPH|nr:aminotransferase class V-fold PLP-dependent enzyme [Cohaesibacter gelatinilyticus]SNZ19635.1 Selenocysteine lyase/Cysteine desulfurase [Cohaesibacter gelatinilyticus]